MMLKIYWFTGLSGSGKTTLGHGLKNFFDKQKLPSVLIDGDELRSGLSSDLGFSDSDRIESNRRAMQITKLLLKSGITPIVSLISPFESERIKIKEQFYQFEFKLIYLDVNINVCKKRDPKGLYKRKISNLSGIDSKYEITSNPDLILDTKNYSIQSCLEKIYKL